MPAVSMAVTSALMGPVANPRYFSDNLFEVTAGFLDERGVGCHAVKDAPCGNFSDFIYVCLCPERIPWLVLNEEVL